MREDVAEDVASVDIAVSDEYNAARAGSDDDERHV